MTAVRAAAEVDAVPAVVDLTDGGPSAPPSSEAPSSDPRPVGPAAPPPSTSRAARLRRLWFVPAGVALLGIAALVPSVGGGGPGPGEARLDVSGTAVVTTADGERRTVRDGRTDVGPGDRVEVTAGTTRFEMADGIRLEGLGGTDGRPNTTVTMAVAPRLDTGPLLAVAPDPLEVRVGDHRVAVAATGDTAGAVRLDRRIGLGVGSYAGAVTVTSAGRTAEVAPYRRIEVAAPGALGPALPLRYAADDAWDRRYLGDALAIDAQLGSLLASSEALAATFLDPAVLADAVDGLPTDGLRGRVADLDDGGDALVLAAIALAASDGDAAAVGRAWDDASAFHADGAPWGLAALDQGARSERVLAAVRDALDTLDLAAPPPSDGAGGGDVDGADGPAAADGGDEGGAASADAAPEAAADGAGGSAGVDGGGTDGGGTDGGSGGTGGGSTPPSSVPPVTTPPLPGGSEVGGAVGGAVGGVVDGTTGTVDGLVPGAGGAVGGVVDGVGGVVSGAGGAVGGAGGAVGGAAGGAVGGVVEGATGAVGGILGGLGTGLGGGQPSG